MTTPTTPIHTKIMNGEPPFHSVEDVLADVRKDGFRDNLPTGGKFFAPMHDAASSANRPQRVAENEAVFTDYILAMLGTNYASLKKSASLPIGERTETDQANIELLAEASAAGVELRAAWNEVETNPEFVKALAKYEPDCPAPDRADAVMLPEISAIRRTPQAAAVREVLTSQTRGRPTDRSLVVAVLEYIAYGWSPPTLKYTFERFRENNQSLDWVFDNARSSECGRSRGAAYERFSNMLKRVDADPFIAMEKNLEAIRELQAIYPSVGVNCAIDAIKIESPHQQGRCKSGTMLDWVLTRDEKVGQIYHGDEPTRGWYLLVISDLASCLPLVWFPYVGSEFNGTGGNGSDLVQRLFDMWPECPMENLIGDSEFGKGRQFSFDLENRFGVHPIFSMHGAFGGQAVANQDKARPVCSKHGPMVRKQASGFLTNKKRQADGIPAGEERPEALKAHVIWKCSDPSCPVKPVARYVKDDPIWNTYWPHAGEESKFYWERKALLRYRSSIESLFAAVRSRSNAAKGASRCRWNSSYEENFWLMSLTLLGMTLGKLAHKNGEYQRNLEKMEQLNLI